ncbi:MAG TPA: glycosyltransferase family 2 protein [Rhodanobacteraceae bacterium]|nr:glycosyltransferase family 2 protein [Rhodanobacteraceae bacterium]
MDDDGGALAAIVVAADSGPVLADCVDALLANDDVAALVLADNASSDGVPESVAAAHAGDHRLHLLTNAGNLGFGAAVNRAVAMLGDGPSLREDRRGAEAASFRDRAQRGTRTLVVDREEPPATTDHGSAAANDWLAIVNPDCIAPPAALAELLRLARTTPRAGLLGAVVCDAAGVIEPATRRRDPLLRRSLAALGLARGEGIAVEGAIEPVLQDVEAVSGALMLVARPLFERLGGFDEGYFLHCEDLDLCRRVRDAGQRVLLAGQVRVTHGKGSSSRHRPVFVAWHKHRGMWRWFRRHDPAARRLPTAALVACGIWLHFAASLPRLLWRKLRHS